MADEKTTKKAGTESETLTGVAYAVEWAKQHPSVMVTILAGLGLTSGDVIAQVNAVLSMDLPGWVVLAVAVGYVVLRIIQDARNTQRENALTLKSMAVDIAEMRAQQSIDADRLLEAEERLDGGHAIFTEHGRRIAVLEDIHESEIQAYREKRKRETGKVAGGAATKDRP